VGNPVNIFSIGKSGLMVSKQSLNATSHNIANVNTEGYSRQKVDQTAGPTITDGGRLAFGTGAWAKANTRVNDQYLDRRIQNEHKNLTNLEEKDIYLQQTEQIFNESNGDGLNQLANKVFNEFRKLSTDPSNTSIRASVREASDRLAGDIRRIDTELKGVSKNIDDRITGYVRDINSLSREIRDLNLTIERAESGGGSAPDLHDKRDLALKRLGAMAEISTSKDKTGRVTVTMQGHAALVVGEAVNELEVMRTPADEKTGKAEGSLDIYLKDPISTNITDILKTGRLGGLLEVRDKDLTDAQDRIDEIAYLVSSEVNNIHRQGFGLDGQGGRDFFEEPNSVKGSAEYMKISTDIADNLDAIAAAKDPSAQSDNRIAIALSGVGDMKGLVGDANSSIVDAYNGMVADLAVKTGATKRSLEFQKDVVTQMENVRDSLVGVSLDEETSNLVQFQHAYAANAKVLNVADELMQTVLNSFK
jgi:flagellar hook-associated protein 1 FlgK